MTAEQAAIFTSGALVLLAHWCQFSSFFCASAGAASTRPNATAIVNSFPRTRAPNFCGKYRAGYRLLFNPRPLSGGEGRVRGFAPRRHEEHRGYSAVIASAGRREAIQTFW